MGRMLEKIIVCDFGDVLKFEEGIISKENTRAVEIGAIVDTGATYVCISKEDIKTLGLPYHDSISIKTANGRAKQRTFKGTEIELKGCSFIISKF